ncbi:MAG TPA: hypothetical protein VKB76_19550, partial [Ktedonobacterales bacterium]|nr:hypothetical protein [Ktedonobacterales bacterium]
MSITEAGVVPVVIAGGDAAAREWCRERIAGRGMAQVIADTDEIDTALAEQIGAWRQGAVIALGPWRGQSGD